MPPCSVACYDVAELMVLPESAALRFVGLAQSASDAGQEDDAVNYLALAYMAFDLASESAERAARHRQPPRQFTARQRALARRAYG